MNGGVIVWVCRAGKDAVHYNYCLDHSCVVLAWDGFIVDLSKYTNKNDFRNLVSNEMQTSNRTSISNWTGQLIAFSKDMQIGDYVLIPARNSSSFTITRIKSEYLYRPDNEKGLVHQRRADILLRDVPKTIFSQDIQYGLRAYRTVYRVKQEELILKTIADWEKKNGGSKTWPELI